MNKGEVLQQFFSGFGLEAYPATANHKGRQFPYLTYTPVFDSIYGGEQSITAELWYYGTGEAEPNQKAQQIAEKIGPGGLALRCDGGFIWIKRGSPWCQPVYDPSDDNLKRRELNISVEFCTND